MSWSGGKDAAWALHLLRQDRDADIAGLFTTVDEQSGHVPIHEVEFALLEAQAGLIGVPLHRVPIPNACPNAIYEERISAFMQSQGGVTHLAFGDLFLEEIRCYRERQFAGSGVELLFPLWGRPTAALAEEMTAAGLRAWITCVDTSRAPQEWAGRVFDPSFVEDIPQGIDPCGENGEFHTFVFQGPMLAARLAARPGRRVRKGAFMHCELLRHG